MSRVFKVLLFSLLVAAISFFGQYWLSEPAENPRKSIPPYYNYGNLPDAKAESLAKLPPREFKVTYTDSDVKYFKQKLKDARFPNEFDPAVNMTYGYPSGALKSLRDDLLNLDWKQWADTLNKYQQFKHNIMGIDIHYVSSPGKAGLKVVPLLLLHGWPGSVLEFYKAIPHLQSLAEKKGFTYDIIVPSIPGFGFSDPCYKPGCDARLVATMFNELMTRLKYDKYICQGGDFGAFITDWIVGLFPERLIGFHVNMFSPNRDIRVYPYLLLAKYFPQYVLGDKERQVAEAKGLFSAFSWMVKEGGYMHIQSTKPNTVSAGLTDSPLGLAAYILEKMFTWTNTNFITMPIEEVRRIMPLDSNDVLYNIHIYWQSNSIQTSCRFYREVFSHAFSDLGYGLPYSHTTVPSGVLMNRYELSFSPEYVVRLKHRNLQLYDVQSTGGHFAAFEDPKFFSEVVVHFTTMVI